MMTGIKQQFMAFRNGVLADTLRKAGWPHKVIFGLNLPQLPDIAKSIDKPNHGLAERLWADKEVRESRLLAAFLFSHEMTTKQIENICMDIRTKEECDILAFRWLRYLPQAKDLYSRYHQSENEMLNYLSTAIERFL